MKFSYDYGEKLVKDSIEIEINNCFAMYTSFALPGFDSYYSLNHEQRHFDINEIYVRKIREHIYQWKGHKKANYNSALVNERAGISPELAIKLSEAFGNTAQFSINLQKKYELWHAEKKMNRKKICHFMAA